VVSQKFTSKERDIETGLDYFIARYYSSAQARFLNLTFELVRCRSLMEDRSNVSAFVTPNAIEIRKHDVKVAAFGAEFVKGFVRGLKQRLFRESLSENF
jgi:hypothetical protein